MKEMTGSGLCLKTKNLSELVTNKLKKPLRL